MDRSIAIEERFGTPSRSDHPVGLILSDLHERYLDEVFRYVRRRVPRREEAEDITAEVFAAAFTGLPRFRGRCPVRLWLLAIARRKVADARRRDPAPVSLASELEECDTAAIRPLWDTRSATEDPESCFLRAEARRTLLALMARLSDDHREVLFLKYWEQLSIEEIAVVMGRSPASVNSLLERARERLRRHGRAVFGTRDGGIRDDG